MGFVGMVEGWTNTRLFFGATGLGGIVILRAGAV